MTETPTAPEATESRRRAITPKQAEQLARYAIDYRFVRECELLEREGFVESRPKLEEDIGLNIGALSQVRAGLRGISTGNIVLLQQKYKADFRYILFGVRTVNHTLEESQALDARPRYRPRFHQYAATARWNIGPREETHAAYFPDDPNNKGWQPSIRRTKPKREQATEQ